jgi:DNA-binding LacI/PurR family transcriptional regulator
VAQELGLAVPGDLSVTGFDDTELSAYVHPALTTVRTDPFGWGQVAARVLLDLVERSEADDEVLQPTALVVRETTGPLTA